VPGAPAQPAAVIVSGASHDPGLTARPAARTTCPSPAPARLTAPARTSPRRANDGRPRRSANLSAADNRGEGDAQLAGLNQRRMRLRFTETGRHHLTLGLDDRRQPVQNIGGPTHFGEQLWPWLGRAWSSGQPWMSSALDGSAFGASPRVRCGRLSERTARSGLRDALSAWTTQHLAGLPSSTRRMRCGRAASLPSGCRRRWPPSGH
jgi:hypothetical protein